jgi:beta-galactosidase
MRFVLRLFLPFVTLPLILVAGAARAATPQNAADLRQRINLNRDWKFYLGDKSGAEQAAYDDSGWDSVGLPHSFSIPYFLSKDFYVGYGWYRRHLDVPDSDMGKRLFLEFEGVFQDAQIFVNGIQVGEHQGGYTGFSLDITSAIKTGDNVLAVRVNNLWNPRLAPRAGEHVFSGGIYRDVYLVVTSPLHVPWYGTFVTTPSVSKEAGTVAVDTEIRNDSTTDKQCTVATAVLDAEGKRVTSMRSTLRVPAEQTITFHQTSDTIAHPKLWDPSHPNLYKVQTTVYDGDVAADAYESPLGFRWFKWTADQGFFLNGRHYYFHGADVHQDHAGWGDAVTDAGVWRDVNLVKEGGFDFIRGSHYPHHPIFADACDQIGILFWSENCFWGTGGFKQDSYWNASSYPLDPADQPGFEQSVKQQLAEEIRIFRNHPSIIVWSMCNEPFFTDKATLPKVRNLLTELVALSHQLDPTRPAAIGGCQRGGLDKLGDVAGYNGDGARLFMNPGITSVVTEYGSVRAIRPGKYDPGWGDLSRARGLDKILTYPWEFPWRSGQALWCCFDHGSIAGLEGQTGIVDYFRLPKRAWYWYRNAFAHVPPPAWPEPGIAAALRLTADKTTIADTDATDDVQLVVTVLDAAGKPISNSPPVELSIISGPGEFPTGPSIHFDANTDIPIRDGQAAIEFRSYLAGPTLIRATSPGLQSADLTITTEGSPVFVAGRSPTARPHPYVRFVRTAAAITDEQFGRDKPTRASSEAPGHSGRLADDGDATTSWLATADDHSPWWQVDLERLCVLSAVNLTFPSPGDYRFKIEVSDDGQTWRTAADQTRAADTDQTRLIRLPSGSRGQFVRVTFTAAPAGATAGLSEFEITGRLATP